MNKDKKERESNIELLRILCAFAVVILHFNMYSNGLSLSEGINHEMLVVLECMAIPAVNVFLIIAGYFNCGKTETKFPIRLAKLEVKVIIVNMIVYTVVANVERRFSIKEMLKAGLPVNYFVTIYCAVMLLAPFLNRLLLDLNSSKQLTEFVIIVVMLFSVYVTCLEVLQQIRGQNYDGLSVVGLNGNGAGYTFVNFMMCYIIGAWLRLDFSISNRISEIKLVIMWIITTLVLFLWHHIHSGLEWQYCNIFVVIQSALLVKIFEGVRIKSRIINALAPSAFTCFLINIPILMRMNISKVIKRSPILLFLYLVVIFVAIFGVAAIFDAIYGYVEMGITKFINRARGTKYDIKKT